MRFGETCFFCDILSHLPQSWATESVMPCSRGSYSLHIIISSHKAKDNGAPFGFYCGSFGSWYHLQLGLIPIDSDSHSPHDIVVVCCAPDDVMCLAPLDFSVSATEQFRIAAVVWLALPRVLYADQYQVCRMQQRPGASRRHIATSFRHGDVVVFLLGCRTHAKLVSITFEE